MGLCTKTDILQEIEEVRLIDLTDDDNLGEVNDTGIATAITKADNEIYSNIPESQQHVLPLSEVPGRVKDWSVTLAIVWLYKRRAIELPSLHEKAYDAVQSQLKMLAKGQITIISGEPIQAQEKVSGEIEARDRVFTDDYLKEF